MTLGIDQACPYNDKIVEEVLRRLEENNLFVKLEKYRRKVREVEFLGVVIGPGRVSMQKEKMDGVLSWPTPRSTKDVQKFMGLTNYYRQFCKVLRGLASMKSLS